MYEITSPIFDSVRIQLDPVYYKGRQFNIITHNNSVTNRYIQKVTLNGKEHTDFWFTHEAFAAGGTLEIWLGAEPNKNWGTGKLPPVTP